MREKIDYTPDFGFPIEMEIINNQIFMQFLEFDESISSIWFQLTLPSNKINFKVAEFGRQFDISLETNRGDNVHTWDLAKMGEGLNLKSLALGILDAKKGEEPHEFEFQYKITSLGGLLSSGTLITEYIPVPEDYILGQAYPNPFNPKTTLHYALSTDGIIALSIYNIQGRLVTELASGFTSAGYYDVTWDGALYSSGMYFIKFRIWDLDQNLQFDEIQKILLVK